METLGDMTTLCQMQRFKALEVFQNSNLDSGGTIHSFGFSLEVATSCTKGLKNNGSSLGLNSERLGFKRKARSLGLNPMSKLAKRKAGLFIKEVGSIAINPNRLVDVVERLIR